MRISYRSMHLNNIYMQATEKRRYLVLLKEIKKNIELYEKKTHSE